MNLIYVLPKKNKLLKILKVQNLIKNNQKILTSTNKSDEFKLFYFNEDTCNLFNDRDINKIIENIKNKDLLNNFELIKKITIKDKKFKSLIYSLDILKNITNQEILKQIILLLKDSWNKVEVIKILEKDEDKLLFLKEKEVYYYLIDIIDTMKEAKNKLKCLEYLPLSYRIDLIKKLDDNIKIEFINNSQYKSYRTELILSLNNKKIVHEYIRKEQNKDEQFKMICNVKYNNEKEILNALKSLKKYDPKKKTQFIIKNLYGEKYLKKIYTFLSKYNYDIAKIYKTNVESEKELKKIKSWIYNVEIDNKITIGVELETSNKNNKLYLDLKRIIKNWKFGIEPSVNNGVEITSPILHYNHDEMKELFFITNYLNKNNFTTPSSCGGHIHIGFDYINDKESLLMLYKLFSSCEQLLFAICNKKHSKMRHGIEKYARPITDIYSKNIKEIENSENLESLINTLKSIQDERYYSLNIINANDVTKNTIEFRFPNGEINYNEILLNIILISKLVEKSVFLANTQDKIILNKVIKLENNIDNEEKLEILLNLLFEDNKIINKYKKRFFYNKNIIEETNKLIKK